MLDLVAFGEILWDVIDGNAHIGGAPFNLAAHAARCGLRAAAVSCVGKDALGHQALAEMARLNVDRRWTSVDPDHPTGTVTVTLKDGQPSYTIHEGVAWDFIGLSDAALQALAAERPRALCFGTLAQRGEASRQTLARLLDRLPFEEVFYDVNLRQAYWSGPLVAAGLARATLVKVNDEEARTLGGLLFGGAGEPVPFARALLERYPLKAVVVTLGADGCLVCERGKPPVLCAGVKIDVVDAVGAGDAFSAAFLAAWLGGATAAEAAQAGNARGAWVAARCGAVPDEPVGQATSAVAVAVAMVGQASSPVSIAAAVVGQAAPPVLRVSAEDSTFTPASGTKISERAKDFAMRTGGDACPTCAPAPNARGSTGAQDVETRTGGDACPTLFKPFNPRAARSVHRRLFPHWRQAGATYFVTWRLADSLPQPLMSEWREVRDAWLAAHPQPWSAETEEEYWDRFVQRQDDLLNEGLGDCLMKDAAVSSAVARSLDQFDGARYRLWRYVVMPNHVHALVTPSDGVELSDILRGWKGYTAKEINRLTGRSGVVWQDEAFDHIVRSETRLAEFVRYIEGNPVKARVRAVVGPARPPELPA